MERRDFLKSAALALLATQPACAAGRIIFRQRSSFEISDLAITDSYIHPVTYKSREAGEADLQRLVKDAEEEEAWLFIKGADNEVWIDVGIEQRQGAVDFDVVFAKKVMDNLDQVL